MTDNGPGEEHDVSAKKKRKTGRKRHGQRMYAGRVNIRHRYSAPGYTYLTENSNLICPERRMDQDSELEICSLNGEAGLLSGPQCGWKGGSILLILGTLVTM